MSVEQILLGVILVLVGVVAGGAGGQALIKKVVSNGVLTQRGQDTITFTTSTAIAATATAAAAAAAANTKILTQHIEVTRAFIERNGETLSKIQSEQVRMTAVLEGFSKLCAANHATIDKELLHLQSDINRTKGRS